VNRSIKSVILENPDFSYRLPNDITDAIPPDATNLVMGVHPKNFAVDSADTDNVIEVTVDVIEPLGKERLLYFELDGTTYIASVDGRKRRVSKGDRIHVTFSEFDLHLFDDDTGRAIKNVELAEDAYPYEVLG